jgi:ketosteroid isomerase-like protein
MMRRTTGTVLGVLGCLAMGCRPSPAREIDLKLARYNRYLHGMQGDSIALLYAPDGEMLATGRAPLRGPAAIAAFLSSFTNITVDSSAMATDSLVMTDSGAVQYARFYQRATPAGRPSVEAYGHILALWQRQSDGHWLIRRLQTY